MRSPPVSQNLSMPPEVLGLEYLNQQQEGYYHEKGLSPPKL